MHYILLPNFKYISNIWLIMSSKEEIKINDKNTTKFTTDNTNTSNFSEKTNNTLNQQQDAINKTLDKP